MRTRVKKALSSGLVGTVLLIPVGVSAALANINDANSGKAESKSQTVVEKVDQALFLLGTFDAYTSDKVIAILQDSPEIELIVFTANGGSINDRDTIKLGHYIRQQGLDTHLMANGVAASGGVSLFLSGARRSVGEGAHVGVHSWAQCSGDGNSRQCKQAKDFPRHDDAHDLHRDYILNMLGTDDFYWFSITSAPHDGIYWLSDSDLRSFQITNHQLAQSLQIPFQDKFDKEYKRTCHNCP